MFALKYSANSFILFFLFLFSCKQELKNTAPNIIVFLVDDMGLMDTSLPFLTNIEGDPINYPLNHYYKTPNMETLAKQGVRFTNFYAHSVCSPSRISILTGQNSARHKTTNWIQSEKNNSTANSPINWNWKGLSKTAITLPKLLQQAGYETIHVGKAHFGPFQSEGENPLNLGFNVNIGGSSIGEPGSYYGKDGYGNIAGFKPRAVKGLEAYYKDNVFLTDALTIEANKAIDIANKKHKPFFLYMSHYAVHNPFQADPQFAEKYKNLGKDEKAQAYATLIEGIDKSLGAIINHVKQLGLGSNTLVLFLGDNGSDAPLPKENNYSSSTPLKGKKGTCWEGGTRVPFIASWVSPNPNEKAQLKTPINKNVIQPQMGSILDLFPTLCEIANISLPKNYIADGFNLQQQLQGKINTTRNTMFLNHFPHAHNSSYFSSLVNSHWKIIYHYPINTPISYELYNLSEDPFETTNLAASNTNQLRLMMTYLVDELKNKNAQYPHINNVMLLPIIPN